MKFVLFTYPDPDVAARWSDVSEEEEAADVGLHVEWFRRHRDKIRGGEELACPKAQKVVQVRDGRPLVTDGPFLESKELLGGFIVVETADFDEAAAMAAEWPALRYPGAKVIIEPVHERN